MYVLVPTYIIIMLACSCTHFHICLYLRLLRSKNRDGTYLIRAGVRAGSEKVLSVWHIDRCRHYKLFKDEVYNILYI